MEIKCNNVWMRNRLVQTGVIRTHTHYCYGLRKKKAADNLCYIKRERQLLAVDMSTVSVFLVYENWLEIHTPSHKKTILSISCVNVDKIVSV